MRAGVTPCGPPGRAQLARTAIAPSPINTSRADCRRVISSPWNALSAWPSERPGGAIAARSTMTGDGVKRVETADLEAAAAGQAALAQAQRLRRDLEQFVLADPLQALLEVHHARRGQLGSLVGSRGAHVRELLLLGDVHVHVVLARVLADDHPLVHLEAGRDEHDATRLEVVDGVGYGAH